MEQQRVTSAELTDSWETISYSDYDMKEEKNLRTSYTSTSFELMMKDALREGSTPPSSKDSSKCSSLLSSPPRLQSVQSTPKVSPITSGHNSPNNIGKVTQLDDVLPKLMDPTKNRDWVWDWSSQPTVTPPKESQFRHPKPKGTPLSLRNTEVMRHNLFSWEFLQVFIPSLIVSNLLAFGLGFYFGRRIAGVSKSS